jgi:hypothetical protein
MFSKLTKIFMNSLVPIYMCNGLPHFTIATSNNSSDKATTLGSLVANLFFKHLAASFDLS